MALDVVLAAVAAFGSVLGSIWAIRAVARHERQACDDRISAYDAGLKEGRRE